MSSEIHVGDALTVLRTLPAESVQCCVTSPPYWGLRDYGVAGQLGLEATPAEYVERMVEVFREVRRVLRGDGTLWMNMGDCYNGSGNPSGCRSKRCDGGQQRALDASDNLAFRGTGISVGGLKPKDLVGIPWRLAFALQADGWWLRSDIIWSKPNPMPESVTDRPTKAHEYLFLLTKSARYYYDAEAISEPAESPTGKMPDGWDTAPGAHGSIHRNGREKGAPPKQDALGKQTYTGFNARWSESDGPIRPTRNARSVWHIATSPFPEAHFATFPPELPRRCILAGSRPGDTVLDPFAGAGTTLLVADRLRREAIGIELNPAYAEMARQRIERDAPLFNREGA